MTSTLVLLRHGQSLWNQQNIFTGWVDVSLSDVGMSEARRARDVLKDMRFDAVFVSALHRAAETAKIALEGHQGFEYFSSKALNERHYGELQGKNKDEMRALYGAEKVAIWRRSFNERPPGGESLSDTCERVLPYFTDHIAPRLKRGETVLISAHGNSLRALVKHLEGLSDEEIVSLEIPTGVPIVYRLNDDLSVLNKTVLDENYRK